LFNSSLLGRFGPISSTYNFYTQVVKIDVDSKQLDATVRVMAIHRQPEPTYTVSYAHDRRAHRHRCRCCNRILNAGERVVMAKMLGHKTWAVHDDCADKLNGDSGFTWRDSLTAWGTAYLRAIGYKLPLLPIELSRG
jgi:hypothetical protein